MRSRFTASAALGAVLALAVTLTGAAAPAFASTPRPDVIPSNPIVTQPNIPFQPPAGTTTVMFKPDVRVVYTGKSNGSGGKVTYRFRVENIGAASASNVGLGTTIYQKSQSVATRQSGSAGTIAALGQDQSKEITVTCTPQAGYVCDGATLQAYLQDDLNPANNKATSP